MLTLPSGRRVAFSLDRFHALLGRIDGRAARNIAENLNDPDDLLFVLDAVHFSIKDGTPYFADYVASDWTVGAADWSAADRHALQAWFESEEARFGRAEAIRYIKALQLDSGHGPISYPYAVVGHAAVHEGSMLRQ